MSYVPNIQTQQSEAIQVVQRIARYNGTNTWLDERTLQQLAGEDAAVPGLRMTDVTKRTFSKFSLNRVSALFNGWQLGVTTSLLWVIWLT